MGEQPTLMFCVGATKAGTSWLYDYVQGHPQCHLRSIKELHYFDTVDLGVEFQIKNLTAMRRSIAAKLRKAEAEGDLLKVTNLHRRTRDASELLEILAQGGEGEEAYLAYLFKDAGDARLVGDLTPAYALLSEDRLARMAKMAPDAKFVFIMRDPLDRLWSHVRMNAWRGARPGVDAETKAGRILNRILKKGEETGITDRGDYAVIVPKLRRAIPAGQLHIAFFEQLTTQDGVNALCDFLGIDAIAAETEKQVFKGVPMKMSSEQRQAALAYLAPQYAFAANEFGSLPQRWQDNQARI